MPGGHPLLGQGWGGPRAGRVRKSGPSSAPYFRGSLGPSFLSTLAAALPLPGAGLICSCGSLQAGPGVCGAV